MKGEIRRKATKQVTIIDYKTKSYENFDVKKGRFADRGLLGSGGIQSSGSGS